MVKKNLNTHLAGSIHRITIKKDKKSIDDIRFKKSGFKKCIQCGRCTASCPAAYMYPDYKPREMMRRFMFNDVHSDDFKSLIWNCGQCYSCRARCPRNCKAVLGVQAFQTKSVMEGDAPPKIMDISKKLKNNLYFHGETFLPSTQDINVLEEFGEKTYKHSKDNNSRRVKLGFKADDARRIPIPDESLQEIRKIMKLTGFMGGKN
jgi:heterodisulfide reductase subunit C1